MKLTLKSNQNRQYYMPKEVAEILGREAELIPNAHAIVVFPKGSSTRRILNSLDVIRHDLENQIAAEEEDKRPEIPANPGTQERLEKAEETINEIDSKQDEMLKKIDELRQLIGRTKK